jgi:hypothetical protein
VLSTECGLQLCFHKHEKMKENEITKLLEYFTGWDKFWFYHFTRSYQYKCMWYLLLILKDSVFANTAHLHVSKDYKNKRLRCNLYKTLGLWIASELSVFADSNCRWQRYRWKEIHWLNCRYRESEVWLLIVEYRNCLETQIIRTLWMILQWKI